MNMQKPDSHALMSQPLIIRMIWIALLVAAGDALFETRWSLAFVSLATLLLSLVPVIFARWADIVVPPVFMVAVVMFVGATLFLGEVYDFYNRFWWWDVMLHGGSAIGFGLIGFVLVFMMFQGDRFAAPSGAIAFFAFCFALAIGAGWEIFEYGMDQIFGTNMQKNGLDDTMKDLMVDFVGALLGAASGYAYLMGRDRRWLAALIADFVARNPRLFSRWKK